MLIVQAIPCSTIPTGCNPAHLIGNRYSAAPFLPPHGARDAVRCSVLAELLYSLMSLRQVSMSMAIPRPLGAGILQAAVPDPYFFPPLPTLLPECSGSRSTVCWRDVDLNCSLYVAV